MIGNGGWRRWATAWPDINDQQYRGIIRAILPILEQYYRYWSKKNKNHIQTLSPGPVYNSAALSPLLKKVCPILGNTSCKKECFLSGIAQITSLPPPLLSGNLYIFFGRHKGIYKVYFLIRARPSPPSFGQCPKENIFFSRGVPLDGIFFG